MTGTKRRSAGLALLAGLLLAAPQAARSATFDSQGNYDAAYAVSFDTTNLRVYVGAETTVGGTGKDILVLEYYPNDVFVTSASFAGTTAGSAEDSVRGIAMDQGSHDVYVLGTESGAPGTQTDNFLVLRFNTNLARISSATIPGQGGGIAVDRSGNIIITGTVQSGNRIKTVQLSTGLNILNQHILDAPETGSEFGMDVAVSPDGSVYVVGTATSPTSPPLYLIKYDSDLTFVSSTSYVLGLAATPESSSATVAVSRDGSMVYAAWNVMVNGLQWDSQFARYSSDLTLLSTAAYGGGGNDYLYNVTVATEGSVYVCGWTAETGEDPVILRHAADLQSRTTARYWMAGTQGIGNCAPWEGLFQTAGWSGGSPAPATWDVRTWLNQSIPKPAGVVPSSATFSNSPAVGELSASWYSQYVSTPLFRASVSTASDFTGTLTSSDTFESHATWTGLRPNTTYYSQVSTNPAGPYTQLGSTHTLAAVPGAFAGGAYPIVGVSSMAVAWSSGTGSDFNPDGTLYIVEGSLAADFNPVAVTSQTRNINAVFTPLSINATYYFRVRAVNWDNLRTADYDLGSTVTIPAAPASADASGMGYSSMTMNWGPNGNPAGTIFEAHITTDDFVTINATAATTAYSTIFSGLLTDTTYAARVRGISHLEVPGGWTVMATTRTLPNAPSGAPGTPVGTVLGVSSVSWTWGLVAGADFYRVYSASVVASLHGTTVTAPFTHENLVPNTTYPVQVAASNLGGEGPLSLSATVFTLAEPPTGSALSNVFATSATLSWNLGNNPAYTPAQVERSTDQAAYVTLQTSATVSRADSGLLGCTSYYYRVRNWNIAGVPTDYGEVQFETAGTTPTPPTFFLGETLASNEVGLSWRPSSTEGVTAYRLFYDNGTGTVNYGSPIKTFLSTDTYGTSGVLASSAAYKFALRAVHRCGVVEPFGAFVVAASTPAVASVQAAIISPETGMRVKGNRLSLTAELTRGYLTQVGKVTFQYRSTGSAVWTDIVPASADHPNPDTDAPYFVHFDPSPLPYGEYELVARAEDIYGYVDPAPPGVIVTYTADPTEWDLTATVAVAGANTGKLITTQKVYNSTDNVVSTGGLSPGDPSATVVLPAGALAASTVTVTIVSNPAMAVDPPTGYSFVGSAVSVNLSNGQSGLSNGQRARITLSYDVARLDPRAIRIFSMDEGTGAWEDLGRAVVDAANRTASVMTPHFSVFVIVTEGVPATDLENVRVYPNPFRPTDGDHDKGKPFAFADPTSGIIFDTLPEEVEIKIFSLGGRLVAKFDTTAAISGKIRWDAKNMDGSDAASGSYLAVISSKGHNSRVKKIVIIR